MAEYRRVWKEKNKEKIRLQAQVYREENKEAIREYNRSWHSENSVIRTKYINSCRKPRVKQATPSWTNKKAIREFYINCPEGYHVDHILPLKGKLVSGLHIVENLQYLPAKENLSKGNKYAIYA